MKSSKKNPYMFKETKGSKLYVKDRKLATETYRKMGAYDKKALNCYSKGDMKKGREYENKSDKLYSDNYHKMFGIKEKSPYDSKKLSELKANTERNAHTKNIYLIAKYGKLSTEKDAKKLYDHQNKVGYLDSKTFGKRADIEKKTMTELEDKFGQEARFQVYKRL